MEWGAEYIGMILVAVGALLDLWRRKRKFERTNPHGVEQFSSFWSKLGTGTKDVLLRFASLALLSVGILVLAIRFEDSWGWIVLLPVYAFALFMMIGS
jgi:hypothetical protein